MNVAAAQVQPKSGAMPTAGAAPSSGSTPTSGSADATGSAPTDSTHTQEGATPHRYTRERTTYWFDPAAEPVYDLAPGERVTIETLDAASGRLQRYEDLVPYLAWRSLERANPATGPFRVLGAEPGDELVVHIEDVKLAPRGWTRLTIGAGAMKHEIEENAIAFVEVQGENGDELLFDFGVRMPARPMVGVIGTALPDRKISTAHPGPHGGNMDFNDVKPGTIVHLPVWVPGANFGIGDVHATMGDSEVSGSAVEISGEVTLRVDLLKGTGLTRPWFELPDAWMTYACAPTLEAAQREALALMATLLTEKMGVTRSQAYLLLTARGDVRIGQAADCGIDATVRVVFPKLPRLNASPEMHAR